MELQHGFFVIEPEYLVDLEGLILYLAKVINSDYLCLFCDAEKDFKSAEAARQHMIDKGHCFMNIYLLEDFCLYYDFSKVLDTIKEEADEEQHSREKEKEKETQVATNASKEKPEDEKSSSDELQAELKEKKILDYQKFIESQLVNRKYNDFGELVLENKTVGHRFLKIYYNMYYRDLFNKQQTMSQAIEDETHSSNSNEVVSQQNQKKVRKVQQDATRFKKNDKISFPSTKMQPPFRSQNPI